MEHFQFYDSPISKWDDKIDSILMIFVNNTHVQENL